MGAADAAANLLWEFSIAAKKDDKSKESSGDKKQDQKKPAEKK